MGRGEKRGERKPDEYSERRRGGGVAARKTVLWANFGSTGIFCLPCSLSLLLVPLEHTDTVLDNAFLRPPSTH